MRDGRLDSLVVLPSRRRRTHAMNPRFIAFDRTLVQLGSTSHYRRQKRRRLLVELAVLRSVFRTGVRRVTPSATLRVRGQPVPLTPPFIVKARSLLRMGVVDTTPMSEAGGQRFSAFGASSFASSDEHYPSSRQRRWRPCVAWEAEGEPSDACVLRTGLSVARLRAAPLLP
jgi:hypothetical protein